MKIEISRRKADEIFHWLGAEIDRTPVSVKYLDLGTKVVRVLYDTEKIVPIIEKQFSFVLKSESDRFDETLVVWGESRVGAVTQQIFDRLDPGTKRMVKAQMLWLREKHPRMEICLDDRSRYLFVKENIGAVEAYDPGSHMAFCAYDSYEPEKFIQHGHAFIRIINKLIRSDTANVLHGAVFGYEGTGFLLCGRGKRGKSTLTMESMLSGFEFVSDDYQILSRPERDLLAYPIYSIITLSYRMYNEMYDRFDGKFVCNNFTQDKYIFNISCYHNQFRTAYPIKLCLFPEIVADEHPSIRKCSAAEKGRAITQLIHSTLSQMDELSDGRSIEKIYHMVEDLPFYKFHLSNDIRRNTEYLRVFLSSLAGDTDSMPFDEPVVFDITYGLATVLDLRSFVFYDMNKFASNIFSLLLSGEAPDIIRDRLAAFSGKNPHITDEFDAFVQFIRNHGFDKLDFTDYPCPEFSVDFAEKSDYNISVRTYV